MSNTGHFDTLGIWFYTLKTFIMDFRKVIFGLFTWTGINPNYNEIGVIISMMLR